MPDPNNDSLIGKGNLRDTDRGRAFQSYRALRQAPALDIAALNKKAEDEINKMDLDPPNSFGQPLKNILAPGAQPGQANAAFILNSRIQNVREQYKKDVALIANEMQAELATLVKPLGDISSISQIVDAQKRTVDTVASNYKKKLDDIKQKAKADLTNLFNTNNDSMQQLQIDTSTAINKCTQALEDTNQKLEANIQTEQERVFRDVIDKLDHRHKAVVAAHRLNTLDKTKLAQYDRANINIPVGGIPDAELNDPKKILDPDGGFIYITQEKERDGSLTNHISKTITSGNIENGTINKMLLAKIASKPDDPNASKVANINISGCQRFNPLTGEWEPDPRKAIRIAKKCYEAARKMGFEDVTVNCLDQQIRLNRSHYVTEAFEKKMDAEKQTREAAIDDSLKHAEKYITPINNLDQNLVGITQTLQQEYTNATSRNGYHPLGGNVNVAQAVRDTLSNAADNIEQQYKNIKDYSDVLKQIEDKQAVAERAHILSEKTGNLSQALEGAKRLAGVIGYDNNDTESKLKSIGDGLSSLNAQIEQQAQLNRPSKPILKGVG